MHAIDLRSFTNIEELARRMPSLTGPELTVLAATGALNSLGEKLHRRDALWQIQRDIRPTGALFARLDADEDRSSPLQSMTAEERMVADYAGTGVTVGHHRWRTCRACPHGGMTPVVQTLAMSYLADVKGVSQRWYSSEHISYILLNSPLSACCVSLLSEE